MLVGWFTYRDINTADSRLLRSPCCCDTGRESREGGENRTLSSETKACKQDNPLIGGDEETLKACDEKEESYRRRRRGESNEEVISEGVKKRPCGASLYAAVIISLLSTAAGEC